MTASQDGITALVNVLAGLSGMGADVVTMGVPESIGPRLSAYVVSASRVITKKATGITASDPRFNCVLAYRADGDVAAAEYQLIGVLDAFIDALNADLTLGGVCYGVEIDLTLSDTPQYFIRAGKEFREYPVLVTLRQYGAFNPRP